MSKTLVLVNSPLQVMMAVNYIRQFKIENVDFAVSFYSIDFLKHNRAVLRYLNDLDYTYKIFITKNIVNILRFYNSPKEYERFVIGDYRSLDKKILTLFHAKGKVQVVYVDDGNASLVIGSKKKAKPTPRILLSKFVDYLFSKRVRECFFYSAFIKEKKILGIPVIPNSINSFHTEKKKKEDMLMIIGCFSRAFKDYRLDYFVYLEKLNIYLRNKWPNAIVNYYPHRREDNMKGIYDICEKFKWEVCFSRINIETDMSQAPYLPCCIVGFGSSALYLLRKMCKDIPILSVHFNESEEYLEIEKKYSEQGIEVISFD